MTFFLAGDPPRLSAEAAPARNVSRLGTEDGEDLVNCEGARGLRVAGNSFGVTDFLRVPHPAVRGQ